MNYKKLLLTTATVASATAVNPVAAEVDYQNQDYIKLASIAPLVEVAGDILVSLSGDTPDEEVRKYCVANGYEEGLTCPQTGLEELCVTERCKDSGVGFNYVKCTCYCNGENTCKEMGYDQTSCGVGYVVDSICPIKSSSVKCTPNPCVGYYTSCSTGYILDTSQKCLSGTTNKYKCIANPCTGYVTSCSTGYVLDTSQTCKSGSTTKYKCKPDPCSGYNNSSPCSPSSGYTQTTCKSGSTTKYKCVAKACTGFNQTSACSPSNGYTQTTCQSGSTLKYKCVANTCSGFNQTSACSPASGYNQSTCQAGSTLKYKCTPKTCASDYNRTSPCSPASGYNQYTCQTGSTTKYKCVAKTCSGYVTSCSTGYVKNTSDTCQAGSTLKYKCKADPCTGYGYTSCSSGYHSCGSCQSGSTPKYKCCSNTCDGYNYTSCPSGYKSSGTCLAGNTWKHKCVVDDPCASYTKTSCTKGSIIDYCPSNNAKMKCTPTCESRIRDAHPDYMINNEYKSGGTTRVVIKNLTSLSSAKTILSNINFSSISECSGLPKPKITRTDNNVRSSGQALSIRADRIENIDFAVTANKATRDAKCNIYDAIVNNQLCGERCSGGSSGGFDGGYGGYDDPYGGDPYGSGSGEESCCNSYTYACQYECGDGTKNETYCGEYGQNYQIACEEGQYDYACNPSTDRAVGVDIDPATMGSGQTYQIPGKPTTSTRYFGKIILKNVKITVSGNVPIGAQIGGGAHYDKTAEFEGQCSITGGKNHAILVRGHNDYQYGQVYGTLRVKSGARLTTGKICVYTAMRGRVQKYGTLSGTQYDNCTSYTTRW